MNLDRGKAGDRCRACGPGCGKGIGRDSVNTSSITSKAIPMSVCHFTYACLVVGVVNTDRLRERRRTFRWTLGSCKGWQDQ